MEASTRKSLGKKFRMVRALVGLSTITRVCATGDGIKPDDLLYRIEAPFGATNREVLALGKPLLPPPAPLQSAATVDGSLW